MNEDAFNMSVRKFLKKVGVTSQREIEKAVREAVDGGQVAANKPLKANVVLSVPDIGLSVEIDGELELD
jgi:hypothetical protein